MPSIRTLALLGNTVALVLLTLLCGAGDTLYVAADAPGAAVRDVAAGAAATAGASGSARATASDVPTRALLVVVDGLRLDVANDAATMPALGALAARGERTELAVEALVPSTIAALQAMIEGRRVAPSVALHDFGATAAPGGGTLERLHAAGGTTVVAATHLWQGLYGRFIDGGLPVPGLPDAASDARVARAAALALARSGPEAPDLVVAHFGALDAAGHRHGGASAAYRTTAARIDAAAAPLVARALEDGRAVVYTSDHGTTDRGGHAGGEPVVRRVPLVVAGGALPDTLRALAPTYQRELPAVLDAALGFQPGPATAQATIEPEPDSELAAPGPSAARLAAVWLAVSAGLVVVARRRALALDARASTAVSGGVWTVLALAITVGPVPAAGVGTGLLAGAALVGMRGPGAAARSDDAARTVAAFLAGVALAACAVADAHLGAGGIGRSVALGVVVTLVGACALDGVRTARAGPGYPRVADGAGAWAFAGLAFVAAGNALGGVPLAALAVAALVAGALTGRARSPLLAGIALAAVPVALARLAGDTASLSSIDVSLAHRMAESPFGLGAAVATAMARLALLPVAVLTGDAVARALHCRTDASAFATLAAVQLGAGLVCALALAFGPATPGRVAGLGSGVPLAAAGLGGLLRELDLGIWLWSSAAAAVGLGAARRALPADPFAALRTLGSGREVARGAVRGGTKTDRAPQTKHADHLSDTNAR